MARLTPDNQRRARDLIALYPYSRSALIPILHILQEQDGYLSEDGMEHVGELLGLTGAEVRGTATFYDMFHLEPVGKYLVAVCTNIACMLQGAYRLLEHAEERLGVAPGGTTQDGHVHPRGRRVPGPVRQRPVRDRQLAVLRRRRPRALRRPDRRLRAGRLDDEVPPHGTLSRVRRTVGLAAAGGPAGDGPSDSRRRRRTGPPGGPVDLDTHRTTTAVASLDGGQPGGGA